MRAACCEATVLRNEVIAPDIRLLTVVWPDRDHAPHAGQQADNAGMAELADAYGSGPYDSNIMRVQVSFPAR